MVDALGNFYGATGFGCTVGSCLVAFEPVDSWSKIFPLSSDNPLARATVPQWWNRSFLSSSLENPCQLGVQQPRTLSN